MVFDIHSIDLSKLNTMTKYPSILTYHKMGEKGRLTEELNIKFSGTISITEKVNGTSCRLIWCPDFSLFVGSREELLYHQGDLIYNPSMGIVDVIKPLLQDDPSPYCLKNVIFVIYGEVYGKGTPAYKNYTKEGKTGFRVFDIAAIEDLDTMFGMPVEELAAWRDNDGQNFCYKLHPDYKSGIKNVERVPKLGEIEGEDLPITLSDTYDWLRSIQSKSLCTLDDGASGEPEGIVIRSLDRQFIAKIRFEDYERTLRKK